jgi:Pyruvate/2-oxoacid:ferredoxin oxidoreductase delta subunit
VVSIKSIQQGKEQSSAATKNKSLLSSASKYGRATVYFATGTGNSYRVAAWFRDNCRERNIPSSLIPVNLTDPKTELGASSAQLVALAFPTHGGLPPWSVIKFLFRMPRRRAAHFLCLPTRGSFYVGSILIPGAAVLASFLPALILLCKGYNPKGAVSFDMPVNMTSFHPPLAVRHANRIIARAKRKSQRYFERFFRRGSLWLTQNNLYELLWSLAILYYIPLFPVLYVLVARFSLGKTMFATRRCLGCGTCAKYCPTKALKMKGRSTKRPYWRHKCEYCLRCLNFCPNQAIEMSHSWAVLIWYIAVSLAAGGLVFTWLTGYLPALQPYHNFWTEELFDALFYYPIFLAGYFLFYQATRFKLVNSFFSYTGWSHYLRQYREPETSLKDFTKKVEI